MRSQTSIFGRPESTNIWRRAQIRQIEDLRDAVQGAGLHAIQRTHDAVTGSLVHSTSEGVALSSGLFESPVAISGPLSTDRITLGVGLDFRSGARQWLRDVPTGVVGVFMAGDEHDAIYGPHALYLVVTLDEAQLEAQAEELGVVVDLDTIRQTGLHARSMSPATVDRLREPVLAAHRGKSGRGTGADFGQDVLAAFIAHLGRPPRKTPGLSPLRGHARIVARAREFIAENLAAPINIDDVARAGFASRRALDRAFADILGEPPRSYVLRLRLHRIRADLATEAEAGCTIATIANRWGISELGRLSGRYRELFGELPSQTAARARRQ